MSIIKQLTIILITLCSWFNFNSAAMGSSLMSEAIDNFQNKRFHAAADLFEQVVKGEPANAQAYYYLGSCLEELKDPDNAKKMYEACFKVNPFSPLGRQAKDAINNLIQKQAILSHPYDEPDVVDTSVRTINQEVNHLQQDKLNFATTEAAYQLQRGNYRAMRFGFQADMANYHYFGRTAAEVSNMAMIRSYDALAYAQRQSTRALTSGYQSARYARESGNNLINSFNEPPSKPDEPQLKAAGTNLYIRNYIYADNNDMAPNDPLVQLKAVAGRLGAQAQANKINGKVNSQY
jgi:tetratricopeptide (TPR) repeat protein